jgi:hypothetical protein
MTIMSFLCRCFSGRCEPPKAERPTTSADLGQKEAKDEALREEQLKHMGGKDRERSASAGSPDLGQTEAKNEAMREEQLKHMHGGRSQRTAQPIKPKKRV